MGRNTYKTKGVNLPDDIWNQLKEECKLRNITIIQALTEAIKMWLASYPKYN